MRMSCPVGLWQTRRFSGPGRYEIGRYCSREVRAGSFLLFICVSLQRIRSGVLHSHLLILYRHWSLAAPRWLSFNQNARNGSATRRAAKNVRNVFWRLGLLGIGELINYNIRVLISTTKMFRDWKKGTANSTSILRTKDGLKKGPRINPGDSRS
jgi:hypothetical protein